MSKYDWGVDYGSVDGNDPPDFRKLRAAGGSFVWIRASFCAWDRGHKAWHVAQDSSLIRDWQAARAAGLVRGAYMFPVLECSATPEEQVANFVQALGAAGGMRNGVDLPPCLDVEFPGRGIADTGLDRDGVVAWIRRAVTALRASFGCWPIIYTSKRVWCDDDADCLANPTTPDLAQCYLWLARYAYATRKPAVLPPPDAIPAPPCPDQWVDAWVAHQDQGDALGVPGFSATVDVDRFRTARKGDRGGHVARYQRALKVASDGAFGPQTEDAVRRFQVASAIPATGVVDAATFAKLAWL